MLHSADIAQITANAWHHAAKLILTEIAGKAQAALQEGPNSRHAEGIRHLCDAYEHALAANVAARRDSNSARPGAGLHAVAGDGGTVNLARRRHRQLTLFLTEAAT